MTTVAAARLPFGVSECHLGMMRGGERETRRKEARIFCWLKHRFSSEAEEKRDRERAVMFNPISRTCTLGMAILCSSKCGHFVVVTGAMPLNRGSAGIEERELGLGFNFPQL